MPALWLAAFGVTAVAAPKNAVKRAPDHRVGGGFASDRSIRADVARMAATASRSRLRRPSTAWVNRWMTGSTAASAVSLRRRRLHVRGPVASDARCRARPSMARPPFLPSSLSRRVRGARTAGVASPRVAAALGGHPSRLPSRTSGFKPGGISGGWADRRSECAAWRRRRCRSLPASLRRSVRSERDGRTRAAVWVGLTVLACAWSYPLLLRGYTEFYSWPALLAAQRPALVAILTLSAFFLYASATLPSRAAVTSVTVRAGAVAGSARRCRVRRVAVDDGSGAGRTAPHGTRGGGDDRRRRPRIA